MLGGSGIGLPPPQVLYPSQLSNVPYTAATNRYTLQPGDTQPIPAGLWLVDAGQYGFVQLNDPVSGMWLPLETYSVHGWRVVNSDGVNFRVANLTGCPIGALVTTAGSGYSAAKPPAVTVTAGSSTWNPIIGGAITTTITLTSSNGFSGGNLYTYTPTVYVQAPPAGGIQASATATVSGGAVTSFTVTQQGAGYATAPNVVVIPDPNDPNVGSIVQATGTTALVTGASATSVTALICTNYGTPLTAVPTLTVAAPGTGTQAVATAIMAFSVTGITSVTAGTLYGNAQPFALMTTGGVTAGTAAYAQAAVQTGLMHLRPAQISGTSVSTGAVTATNLVIADGGLFQAVPSLIPIAGGTAAGVANGGAATAQVGGNNTTVLMTPLGSNF